MGKNKTDKVPLKEDPKSKKEVDQDCDQDCEKLEEFAKKLSEKIKKIAKKNGFSKELKAKVECDLK